MSTPGSTLHFVDATHVRVGRRHLLYFGGTGYLGLAFHPAVREALAHAALAGLLHSGASRTTTGEQPEYLQMERRLARFFRVNSALLVSGGYLAPIAVTQGLRRDVTHVLVEDLAHGCVQDAAAVAGVGVDRFVQGDVKSLQQALRRLPRGARPLVACDGTWGTRGGMSPVDGYLEVLPARSWLLVDDAHGAGSVGPGGRGACALLGIQDARILQTISLAKSFGLWGGVVLGDRQWVAQIRERAAAFVGTTAPLLPAMAALEVARQLISRSDLVSRLQRNTRLLHEGLPRRKDVISDPRTPVVGIYPAGAGPARRLRQALLGAGIFPSFIRYLNGPAAGFLRLAVQAGHREEEVAHLAAVVSEVLPGIP